MPQYPNRRKNTVAINCVFKILKIGMIKKIVLTSKLESLEKQLFSALLQQLSEAALLDEKLKNNVKILGL